MARITPKELWKLVVKTGLCDRSAAKSLRAEHDRAHAGADARDVAAWLADRGVLTRWQAKRLAAGDDGPFFYGDYRLLERHDRDGEAFEFTARHEPSGRIVTVVLLSRRLWGDPAIRAAIVRRTGIAVGTTDPLLVRTWALEEAEGRPFVVGEEVRGEPLADELARRGPLPHREAGSILLASARAVAELHAAGEVHGGLSLDAIVREPAAHGGRLRLRQFPLATDPHRVPPRPALASEEELLFLGRRSSFIAPELVGGAACDPRSDVYALGCMLQALVAGNPPHWRGDARETLDRAAATGPGPLDAAAPAPLARLIEFMTARDPRDRYQDAAEAARAIAATFGFPPPDLPAARPQAAGPELAFDVPAASQADGASRQPVDPTAARLAATEAARRRGRRLRFVGGVLVGGILAAAAALVIVRTLPEPGRPRPPAPSAAAPRATPQEDRPRAAASEPTPERVPEPAVAAEPRSEAGPAPAAGATIVDDDTLPWASPTAGPPPEIAWLPAGSQLIVVARPAELLADEEGRLLLKALGPDVERALAEVAKACGCAPADIEALQAGWQTEGADTLVAGWAAQLVPGKAVPPAESFRTQAWGRAMPDASKAGETVYGQPLLAYWAPSKSAGRVLVAAPPDRLAEIVEASATTDPPRLALPGDMELLAGRLDGSRHLVVLGSPHYLLHGGRALLAGPLEPLAGGLESLLGEAVQAAALSLHCGPDFYVELAAVASLDLPARELAARLGERIGAYPAAAKAFCAARELHPYGRALVMELPTMVRALAANVRSGPEGKVAVANAYLPRHAGHNLLLAAELALAQAQAPVATRSAASTPAPPRDALGRLAQEMTLVFPKDTLEKSIQMISEEIGVPMEILGPDLQLEGITKNQSFALEERNKPAEAILRVILAKANPDGKLVYVVRKKGDVESIEITTRAAVAKRGDTLPPAFQEAGTPAQGKR